MYIYRISSNKRQGAYLIFRVKGGALIERRALNRGVCVCVCVGGGGGGGWRGKLIKCSSERNVGSF